MMDDMDPIRRFINLRLSELGLNKSQVSKQLGRSHAYLQQFIERGVPRQLSEEDRAALAHILDVPEDRLRPARPASNVRPAPSPNYSHTNRTRDNREVPVWRAIEEGPEGAFTVEYGTEPVDRVRKFPGIENATGIYALYIVGQSMNPAYRAGDLIYVSETKPPSVGSDVIVQCMGPEDKRIRCYLKRLVSRIHEKIVCEQFNPPAQSIFEESEIVGLHRVLTLAELAGT
jgi:phage repressor protein C with HTH and peptisase S24 domain